MTDQTGVQHSRTEVLPAFIGTVVGACALYFIMNAVQPMLAQNTLISDFGTMLAGCMAGLIPEQVHWFFADLTETTFIASLPASIGLVAGALIAAHLEVKGSPLAGTGVDGNGHIYGRLTLASVISVALGIVVFGNIFPGFTGWIPTFAVLLVVQPLIIQFGASPAKLVTCILLATFVTFPVAYLIIQNIVTPLAVPLFVGVSIAVAIVVPILNAVCKALPWMAPEPKPAPTADVSAPAEPSPTAFFLNRVFGDIGELAVTGSSISTVLMYAGAIFAWVMNPFEPAYGAGNLPLLLASQMIVAAVAIFIYYPKWKRDGFIFTFAGVVFTSAIVGGYCATGTPADFIIAGATILIGSVIFVPVIETVMKLFKFNGSYPAICLIQGGIFPMVTIWALLLNHVIVPTLSVM